METNREISSVLYEIADFLSMNKDEEFRIYAYRKAAASLESLEENIEDIYQRGGVKEMEKISGIGKSIALLIKEYIEKGKVRYLQELGRKTPVDLKNLTRIEGVGSKTIKTLYQKLGVKNVRDLKKAAEKNEIAPLFGFGEKKEKSILEGIKFLEKSKGRMILREILPESEKFEKIISLLPETEKVSVAGSLRRRKETIGDIDFLVSSKNPKKLIKSLLLLPDIAKVIGKGEAKLSIKTKNGFNVDFRVVVPECFGSALQYFTGSKEHNIQLRKLAMKKGLKINEYGIFKGKKRIGGGTEEEIYTVMKMKLIPPEIREGSGEIQAAMLSFKNGANILPKLVEQKDIKGDLHCHSDWSGGEDTIEEMAREAENLGYHYIGIADHTKYLRIENGLDEKELRKQGREIKKINDSRQGKLKCRVLHGCEANILKNGALDIKDSALEKLDFVIAGIHSHFKMEKNEMTERIIKAMKNPRVGIIAHPTGRILGRREEYQVDFQKIIKVAKETKTALEINAYPERLDLYDLKIRKAKEFKVKMIINSDAHGRNQMKFMKFGVFQARRGWAEEKDIINTYSLQKITIFLRDI